MYRARQFLALSPPSIKTSSGRKSFLTLPVSFLAFFLRRPSIEVPDGSKKNPNFVWLIEGTRERRRREVTQKRSPPQAVADFSSKGCHKNAREELFVGVVAEIEGLEGFAILLEVSLHAGLNVGDCVHLEILPNYGSPVRIGDMPVAGLPILFDSHLHCVVSKKESFGFSTFLLNLSCREVSSGGSRGGFLPM